MFVYYKVFLLEYKNMNKLITGNIHITFSFPSFSRDLKYNIIQQCSYSTIISSSDCGTNLPIKLKSTGKKISPCAAPNITMPKYILK